MTINVDTIEISSQDDLDKLIKRMQQGYEMCLTVKDDSVLYLDETMEVCEDTITIW